ncbi:MAG TPA: EAL domain-containing protein [Pirellulaceae bacterium]|jgi:EAL domain-containing protein (putative c-di-GMP-specific phosphodiesterase class I)
MPSLALNPPQPQTHSEWSLMAQDTHDVQPLATFPAQIGRHPTAPIRVIHPTVSLFHAELRRHGDTLELADLGSRNGTFVNGKRLSDPRIVRAEDLLQFGGAVFRLQSRGQESHIHATLNVTCQSGDVGDLALALAQFEKLVSDASVVPVYQPIVKSETSEVFAYEALARSRLYGLDKPAQMFQAAEYFQMEAELSRMLRREELTTTSETVLPHLFLNTHPAEMADFKELVVSLREIREKRPTQPLTIEVHEKTAADIGTLKMLRMVLDDLNMKLAYDDFGAGQARLHELVEARPDFVKFDRQLVMNIDKAASGRRQLVESLVKMCRQLGIVTLAEGIETAAEATVCRDIGFELMQGFYYGRPNEFARTTPLVATGR